VAHDFNNLLQVVSSGANLLRSDQLGAEERQAVLESLTRAGESARELTGRLLAFARRQTLRPEAFALPARLEAMRESLRATLGPACRLELALPEDLWPVHADPGQFEIALLNLAGNARDAMPAGGVLRLEAANAAGPEGGPAQLRITLRDQGQGMAPAVLERIFEPFFTTKPPGRGTGLGLAQVHGFTIQSSGSIAVESAPGKGTAVTLHLPALRGGLPAGTAEGAVIDALNSSAGRSVLVVEDNEDAGAFAAALLRELGYATSRAGTGEEALAMIEAGPLPDAIFSDIAMPGAVDGVSLAEHLQRQHPGIAVVLATGYSDRLAAAGGLTEVTVLQKPYRLDELATALLQALNAVAPAQRPAPPPEGGAPG
jgi:CheY-like chemotaxis protein